MRSLFQYFFFAITTTAIVAGQPSEQDTSDVAKLLSRSAAAYAKIGDYEIEIRHSRTGYRSGGIGGDLPWINVLRLSRAGNTLRFEANSSEKRGRVIWVDNGTTTWRYSPSTHEYTETPSAPRPPKLGPGPGLQGVEWTYFLKFRALAEMATNARIVKARVPPDQECPHESAILELQLNKEMRTYGNLRIDRTTDLVCRLEVNSVSAPPETNATWATVDVWKYNQIEGSVPQEQLAFVPPRRARRVKRFSTQRRDPPPDLPELKQ